MVMRLWMGVCTLLVLHGVAEASLTNGDFSSGLDDWYVDGNVTADFGAASLTDVDAIYSGLYQDAALLPGTYTLQFDLWMDLSPDLPDDGFAFYDMFAVSLYLFSDTALVSDFAEFGTFLESGSWTGPDPDEALALLSADTTGVYENLGSLTSLATDPDWWHFEYTFSTPYTCAVPVFELFDLNTISDDSQVLIDNVRLDTAVVPEPGTASLLGIGILVRVVAGMRRNRRQKQTI